MSLCNYSVCIANFNKPFFKFTSNDQFNYLLVGLFCGFQFFLVVVVCLNKLKAARVQPVEASAESFLTHETSHLETSFIILGIKPKTYLAFFFPTQLSRSLFEEHFQTQSRIPAVSQTLWAVLHQTRQM